MNKNLCEDWAPFVAQIFREAAGQEEYDDETIQPKNIIININVNINMNNNNDGLIRPIHRTR